MQTMIAIQDDYIARVLACSTGHWRRVKRAARHSAFAKLTKLGFTIEQCSPIISDADDVAKLERLAAEG
jgi:hypothetical protein